MWYTDENKFLLSSRPASSFAAEGDEGFSLQDNAWQLRAGRGQVPRTEKYANPGGQNADRSCVAVMTNYGEDPTTVIGHSLQLKNATRFFFFDIVIGTPIPT